MNTTRIIMVRIYTTESSHLLKTIVTYLKNEAGIRGVTVHRGISGFGETGEHSSSLLDLSLDLPLVIEFFDSKEKIEPALTHLDEIIKAKHIVFWEASANDA